MNSLTLWRLEKACITLSGAKKMPDNTEGNGKGVS